VESFKKLAVQLNKKFPVLYGTRRLISVFILKLHTALRYDGDQMTIRLAYGTTQPFVTDGTSHTEDDTIMICSEEFDGIRHRLSMPRRVSLSSKHIATKGGNHAFKVLYYLMQARERTQT
jgi:hypothetical protein